MGFTSVQWEKQMKIYGWFDLIFGNCPNGKHTRFAWYDDSNLGFIGKLNIGKDGIYEWMNIGSIAENEDAFSLHTLRCQGVGNNSKSSYAGWMHFIKTRCCSISRSWRQDLLFNNIPDIWWAHKKGHRVDRGQIGPAFWGLGLKEFSHQW